MSRDTQHWRRMQAGRKAALRMSDLALLNEMHDAQAAFDSDRYSAAVYAYRHRIIERIKRAVTDRVLENYTCTDLWHYLASCRHIDANRTAEAAVIYEVVRCRVARDLAQKGTADAWLVGLLGKLEQLKGVKPWQGKPRTPTVAPGGGVGQLGAATRQEPLARAAAARGAA